MSDFPKEGKELFVEGGHQREFAHIAWGDTDSQFYAYITGYKEAADLVIQNALEKGDPHTLDTFLFPASFLYRQYIELVLKDIYLSFSDDNREEKKTTIKRVSHDLVRIWDKVKPIILKYFPDEDKSPLIATEEYIKQFAEEDKNSFVFRYPITKKLELVHSEERRINLANLAERMDELKAFLSAVSGGISHMAEVEADIKADYESEMRSIMQEIEQEIESDYYKDMMDDYPY